MRFLRAGLPSAPARSKILAKDIEISVGVPSGATERRGQVSIFNITFQNLKQHPMIVEY
jgi:hypothetical protein